VLEVVLMSNGDYREKIEEHRQSIELEEQQSSRMSRSRQVKKKKKKPRKNPLLNILLVILLGIPFTLLIYVSFFYDPTADSDMAEVDKNENGSIVEVQKNNTVSAASGKENSEPEIEETKTDEQATTNEKVSEDKKAEEAKQSEVEAAKKAEEAKQKEQEKLAKQEEEQKQKEQQTAAGTTHTVQPNENLFRIALKYYNDASGVDKIKEANNLSSNSISVGQTLIIP